MLLFPVACLSIMDSSYRKNRKVVGDVNHGIQVWWIKWMSASGVISYKNVFKLKEKCTTRL